MDTATLRIVAIALEQERDYGSGAKFLRAFADLHDEQTAAEAVNSALLDGAKIEARHA